MLLYLDAVLRAEASVLLCASFVQKKANGFLSKTWEDKCNKENKLVHGCSSVFKVLFVIIIIFPPRTHSGVVTLSLWQVESRDICHGDSSI